MKNTLKITIALLLITTATFAQKANYQLSSHILDISKGQPAPDVKIRLSKQDNQGIWVSVDEKVTDQFGRINNFLKLETDIDHMGIYKLTYFTEPYFQSLGQKSFYPFIEVIFEVKDNNHYHVPITLSAFGYSTYRGN